MKKTSSHNIRRNPRKSAYRRQKRRQIIVVAVSFALIFGIVIGINYIFNRSGNGRELLRFQGSWVYDEYTRYEFDGKGRGCMCLEDLHYEYSYEVKKNELFIDFDDGSVHDCTYEFAFDGDKLSIIGKEGTVGGTYILNKQ